MAYKDPILSAYEKLIRNRCKAIKTFYQGEPVGAPTTNLPFCSIAKIATRVGPVDNAEDGHELHLRISVVTDLRKDLSTQESRDAVAAGVSTLYDILEGRNPDGTLKDTCILDILRSNLLVPVDFQLRTDLGSITEVNYGFTLKDRNAETWLVEGNIDFVANFIQVR